MAIEMDDRFMMIKTSEDPKMYVFGFPLSIFSNGIEYKFKKLLKTKFEKVPLYKIKNTEIKHGNS
jgi:hypothetical protein